MNTSSLITSIFKKPSAMTSLLVLTLVLYAASQTIPALSSTTAYPSAPGTETTDCSVSGTDKLIPVRREVYDGGRIIDITHRYSPDMPEFGSSEGIGQFLWLAQSMKNGSLANQSEMKMPTHTGTHVDAPGHFFDHYFDAGFDVDTLDLEVLNGSFISNFLFLRLFGCVAAVCLMKLMICWVHHHVCQAQQEMDCFFKDRNFPSSQSFFFNILILFILFFFFYTRYPVSPIRPDSSSATTKVLTLELKH
jgi:hypothetical protein